MRKFLGDGTLDRGWGVKCGTKYKCKSHEDSVLVTDVILCPPDPKTFDYHRFLVLILTITSLWTGIFADFRCVSYQGEFTSSIMTHFVLGFWTVPVLSPQGQEIEFAMY